MHVHRSITVAVLLVFASTFAGCAGPMAGEATTMDQVLKEAHAANDEVAVEALSDLTVSRAEVDDARNRMVACLEAGGLEVIDHGVNPLDSWRHELDIHWEGMSDADGQRLSEDCQIKHYAFVSNGYHLMNVDEIDPVLLPEILKCVRDKGTEAPADARSLRALLPLGSEDPNLNVVTTCAETVAGDHGFTALSIVL